MKIKSSLVLKEALQLLLKGEQQYACAAIQDVETTIRWETGEQNVSSKAQFILYTLKPAHVPEANKSIQQWWEKGDEARILAVEKAIQIALKRND